MRASTLCLALLLVAVPVVALAPAAGAHDIPPEEIGNGCWGLHWHDDIDPANGDVPHYHTHWYCF